MNIKKIITVVIILVILIAASAIFLAYKKNLVPTVLAPEQSTSLAIKDTQITDNTKPFKIDIVYPQIAGLDEFNQKAKTIIEKEINDFKTNSLANDEAVKKVDPVAYAKYPREYDLNIGYDKGRVDENVVSIVFNVYNFEGGAHGASYFVPLNYDVKNKKEIALTDIFSNQPDYLQKISSFCIADLTKQITDKLGDTGGAWIQDGAGPVADNFQFFLINPSTSSGQATLTFYFPQYQVAPGAAGDFQVTMPR